jgi:hypothetical protein
MASGIQQGAKRARFSWSDCGTMLSQWTGGETLPVVNETTGGFPRVFVGFHPFASHVIVANTWEEANETYIETIEDKLALDEGDLSMMLAEIADGKDHAEVLDLFDAEYGPNGKVICTDYVQVHEVPVAAITWLAAAP